MGDRINRLSLQPKDSLFS